MSRPSLQQLRDRLTSRDYQLLVSVEKYRLLTTKQLQRLHFDADHPTPVAAARACSRTLLRLKTLGLLAALERRIGGARSGSAGFVWYLGPAGDRLLRSHHRDSDHGRTTAGRRNYREPSRHFVEHTLAVAELAISAIEAGRSGSFEVLAIQIEPASWQQALSAHGVAQWLKPDLRLVTGAGGPDGGFEDHWFVELDRATEHLPVIARQCAAYATFYATGRYQADHQLFPAVIWVVPSERRRQAVRRRILEDARLPTELFTVITGEQFTPLLTDGINADIQQLDFQEGGTP